MKRNIILLAAVVALLLPTPAYACSGFIDCLFGFTERTNIRAERDAELARIEAERDRQVADINALAQERVKAAEAQVEQVKQQRYESEAARDVAIAQAQAQADEYKAMVAALSSEKIAGIDANAQTQIVALQEQARIATQGILQTGKTERYRIVGGWTFAIVALLVIALLIIRLMVHRERYVPQTRVLPGERRQLSGHQSAYIEARRSKAEVVYYEED